MLAKHSIKIMSIIQMHVVGRLLVLLAQAQAMIEFES